MKTTKNKPIEVVIVDDHQIFRDGVASMIANNDDIIITGMASDAFTAIEMVNKLKPGVVLLDISMPEKTGLEIIENILSDSPHCKILILSMHTEEEYIAKAINYGAKGYLPKQDTSRTELVSAIIKVNNDEEYFGKSVSKVIQRIFLEKISPKKPEKRKNVFDSLSKREKEILRYVMEGFGNQEIADKTFVNIRTVETHKSNILTKLQLKNSVELVKFAIKNNFYEL